MHTMKIYFGLVSNNFHMIVHTTLCFFNRIVIFRYLFKNLWFYLTFSVKDVSVISFTFSTSIDSEDLFKQQAFLNTWNTVNVQTELNTLGIVCKTPLVQGKRISNIKWKIIHLKTLTSIQLWYSSSLFSSFAFILKLKLKSCSSCVTLLLKILKYLRLIQTLKRWEILDKFRSFTYWKILPGTCTSKP